MIQMAKIKLTKNITLALKEKREEYGFSQEHVATEIGISASNYKRIELGYNQFMSKEVRDALSELFDLNDNFWLQSASKPMSYRVPRELYDYIQGLKIQYNFTSDAEAISYCIKEHKKKSNFKEVQYELEDMIETIMKNTYDKTMITLIKQLQDYEFIKSFVEREFGINVQEVLETNKQKKILEKRARVY